jgi:hypothetical protein
VAGKGLYPGVREGESLANKLLSCLVFEVEAIEGSRQRISPAVVGRKAGAKDNSEG